MRHMKTERENYLKPQTIMEQVAMEQGICAASIIESPQNVEVNSTAQGYNEIDASKQDASSEWSITWE